MMRPIGAFLAALLSAPALVRAQTIPKDFVYDVKHGALDILTVWASPFHGSLHKYEVAVASLGVVALSSLEDDNVAAWVRGHPNAGAFKLIEPWRERSGLSFVNSGSGAWHPKGALAVYTIGLFVRSPAIRDLGMGCLSASEAHAAVRTVVYATVARERPLFSEPVNGVQVERPGNPYDFKVPGSSNWFGNSFFSGHVTSITSCVTFINTRFHLGYVEPVLWAFDAGLALGRVADQRHYTSDILLGALLGYSIGKLVGERSLKRAERKANDASSGPRRNAPEYSWTDGVYVSRLGEATLIGWKTPR